MRCPRCGFENPEGLKFCGECGTAFTALCPRCGFANPSQFKFCGDCGASLVPALRPSSTPSRAAQPLPPSRYTPAYLAVRSIHNDLHMGYSAIGQTVHLAARMEQLATPGSILLAQVEGR